MKQIGFSYSRIQAVARWFLPLCLLALLPLSASAQETIEGGEAFYIWQNDGHFNGFFYDQVQEIRYSRFDTLNVEHNDYVSQEVVTADSTYRIMLTAIDSVSFVQPEIKYAKAARFMRDEGMMTYYRSMVKTDDTFTLTFSSDMPSALRPKVGDVLICPDLPDYDEAFVGKVKRVSGSGGGIVVECGYVDSLSDVFEQFITVEQVQGDNMGRPVRRRIAGYNAPRRIEGNYDNMTLFNFSRDFEDNLYLNDALKLGLKLHVGMGMSATVAYKIRLTEFFLNAQLREYFEVGLNASLDGSISGDWDLKSIPGVDDFLLRFTKIPFPVNIPVMYLNVAPMPFIRAEAHITAGLNTGVMLKAFRQSFTVKSEEPYIDFGLFAEQGDRTSGDLSLYAELSGLVQFGVKYPILVEEEKWLKNIFSFTLGNTVYAGPKLSGAFSFDMLKGNADAYNAYRNTKVEFSRYSLDMESLMKFVGWRGFVREKKWTHSFNFGGVTLTLYPQVSKMKYELTGNLLNTVKAHYDTSGEVFWPQNLGIALYTKENDQDTKFSKLYRSRMYGEIYFLNTFNSVDLELSNIDPGEYRLRPVISLKGGSDELTPVYNEEQTVLIAPKELILDPKKIEAEEEGGEFLIQLLNSIDMPLNCYTDQDWIHPEIRDDGVDGKVMVVKVDPNETSRYREGSVTVRLRLTTIEAVEKVLPVKQYGGLQVSPTSLNFNKEGGEEAVDLLTSNDPVDINLNGAESWLSYERIGHKLFFKAKKNEGEARSITVIISGWNPRHEGGFNRTELKVSQEQGDIDARIDQPEVTLGSSGVSQRVPVTNGSFTLSDAVVRKESQDWLMVEKQASGVIVTATPNTTSQPRIGYIDLTFTKTGSDGQKYKVTLTLKVTQKAAAGPSVSPTSLTYEAAGGTQVVTITPQGYARRGYIIPDADKSWLSGEFGDNNTIKFTATANTTGKDRTTTIRCYVTNVQNSTDAQRVYLDDVKVLQKAAQQSALKIKSVVLYVGYRSTTPKSFTVDWNKNEGVIQAVASGSGVHVTCTNKILVTTNLLFRSTLMT